MCWNLIVNDSVFDFFFFLSLMVNGGVCLLVCRCEVVNDGVCLVVCYCLMNDVGVWWCLMKNVDVYLVVCWFLMSVGVW